MADRSNSERLRGFCDRWTDGQTDICDSRLAFATENCVEFDDNLTGQLYVYWWIVQIMG